MHLHIASTVSSKHAFDYLIKLNLLCRLKIMLQSLLKIILERNLLDFVSVLSRMGSLLLITETLLGICEV